MTRPQAIATTPEAEDPVTDESVSEPSDNVTIHPRADRSHHLRIVEALLFAAAEPLSADQLSAALPEGADLPALLADLQTNYANRGVNLVQVSGKWALRTAGDLSFLLRREAVEQKRLSKAGLETLAIIAYHQPITRAELEEMRGVAVSKGTLDLLLETGWVQPKGRRETPGRPVTWVTTPAFLDHFDLAALDDLPRIEELLQLGLLGGAAPGGSPPRAPPDGEADEPD
jgi:segregation and condensation protein B